MTKTFRFSLATGFSVAKHEETHAIEFSDGVASSEIEAEVEEYAKQWAWEKLDFWWEEVPLEEKQS